MTQEPRDTIKIRSWLMRGYAAVAANEEGDFNEIIEEVKAAIRAAENDALERAAEFFEHGDVTFAADIRALKHGDPA